MEIEKRIKHIKCNAGPPMIMIIELQRLTSNKTNN